MQEKNIKIKDLNVNYKIIGEGETPIVLLHGWGLSSDKYLELAEKIIVKNKDLIFYIPDLPGFGKSDEPNLNWNLDDYTDFTKDFVEKAVRRKSGFELVKNIFKKAVENKGSGVIISPKEKVTILAHSFGGRIAIKYAIKYPKDLEKIFLTGAAGIRRPLTIKKKLLKFLAKTGNIIFSLPVLKGFKNIATKILYKFTKEKDYKNASPQMKEVMKNALNENLINLFNDIETETILIWGENDLSTPLADGKIMNEKISNSKLFIVKNANHSLPYNNSDEFSEIFINNL